MLVTCVVRGVFHLHQNVNSDCISLPVQFTCGFIFSSSSFCVFCEKPKLLACLMYKRLLLGVTLFFTFACIFQSRPKTQSFLLA